MIDLNNSISVLGLVQLNQFYTSEVDTYIILPSQGILIQQATDFPDNNAPIKVAYNIASPSLSKTVDLLSVWIDSPIYLIQQCK